MTNAKWFFDAIVTRCARKIWYNQDVLENFFGTIKAQDGLHDHPNTLEFRYRLRSYIMDNNEGAYSSCPNLEVVDTAVLKITGQLIEILNIDDNTVIENNQEFSMITQDSDLKQLHELAYDGLQNLADFICYKPKDHSIESTIDESASTWIDHPSEGGLHKPSEEFEGVFNSVK